MGYELHIIRNDDYWDGDGGISFEEWASLVELDDAMRMDGFAEVELPGEIILRTESKGLAVWQSYAGNVAGGNQAWFDFREGGIAVKNPDQDIFTKMLEIASSLDAKVVGDDGEEYNSPSDYGVPEDFKPWWKFW